MKRNNRYGQLADRGIYALGVYFVYYVIVCVDDMHQQLTANYNNNIDLVCMSGFE